MTVEEFFDDFLISYVNLNAVCKGEHTGSTPGCDICLVKTRHESLTEELKNKLSILPSEDEENKPSHFLTGSYKRHTMIRPPKDVDLFIVLDSGEYQDSELNDLITPRALINKLKGVLEDIFADDENIVVKGQRHSVTVIYDEAFSIDVIPAFETDGGDAYKIPDIETGQNGRYIISNPNVHYDYINGANESTNVNGKKRFKRIVRLLKFVKRREFNDGPTKIRSFHFELLAAQILSKGKIDSYAEGINKFLSEAEDYFDRASIVDPANKENMVDDYLDELEPEARELIKTRLNKFYEISNRAVELEGHGNNDAAIREWGKIFYAEANRSSTIVGMALGDTSHAKPMPWRFFQKYKVSIDAYTYIRTGTLKKLGGINSDGRRLQDGILLKYIASTDTPEPYTIKWQVVNTGPHAASKRGLRGNFFDAKLTGGSPSSNKHINWEHTEYTGKHWIECFAIKDNTCVARSGRFYVNIKNPEY